MNNGQPPYGDPSAWGQQGNQANPAQYPVQPNPYAQQATYPQVGQQPYGQPQQQDYAQPFASAQTYGQQQHPQQQVYQQQSWQPYDSYMQQPGNPPTGYPYGQQPAAQPYYEQQTYTQQQPYAQQTYGQPQQAYPQFNQMGQQVQQGYGNGYSGYYSQPQQKKFEIPLDVIGKVILFGVLPALFILAMLFAAPALKWVFLAGAVGGIILMWMREIVSPNMRVTMSLVLGVMAVVALVGALSGAPQDAQNVPGNASQSSNSSQQSGSANVQSQDITTPTVEPTGTPAPEDAPDSAVEQVMSFFYYWAMGNDEAMLARTAPSWRASVDNPASALFVLLLNRTPQEDYEVTSITGTDNDVLRTATVKVTIDKNDGRSKMDRYAFKVLLKKEDGIWYVDPQSLSSNEKEMATETTASANTTPTQPPLYTGNPSTVLYYNPNGGVMYHLDPDCPDVGAKFKPMTSFMYTQLGQSPYKDLRPCMRCGAPIPDAN
ncbi:MAG: hypothetical protein ACI4WX_11460 [Aristaeellaceae bacterium]